MEFNFSDKANSFKPNIFNILNERKAKMIEKGHTVYDLFVGTPDLSRHSMLLMLLWKPQRML